MKVRRLFWCEKCAAESAKDQSIVVDRVVVREGDPTPRCHKHGPMTRQRNKAYRGKAVPE